MNYLNALPQSLMTVLNLADRVAAVTTAAADRAITVWSFLTQPQAIATYKWLGAMTLALVELTIWSAIWAYARIAQRFEPTKVEPNPQLEAEYFETVEGLFAQADEVISQSMPQVITAPVTTLVIPVDRLTRSTVLHEMTLPALTPLAQDLGLKTNKVRKADLISAILDAEGYTNQGAAIQATTEEE